MMEQPEPGSQPEPIQSPEPQPATPPLRRPFEWRLPLAFAVICGLVGVLWWNTAGPGRQEPRSTPTPIALITIPTATPRPPTRTPTPIPTETPTAVPTVLVILPTVTPTNPPTPIPVRTVEFSGQVTLRLELANPAFSAAGRPLEVTLQPRRYELGNGTHQLTDHWCTALGASSLVFDISYRLQPGSQTLSVNGEMQLYDGFCHDLGEQRAVTPLQVDIPVEASARLTRSLNAESSLLNRSDLLNTTTSVYAELLIRNPRPR